MAKKLLAQLVATKTLIRVAFSILSLSGIAHAQTSVHRVAPQQSSNAYNYVAGGGGLANLCLKSQEDWRAYAVDLPAFRSEAIYQFPIQH